MERTTYFIGVLIIITFNCANASDCNGKDTCAVNKNRNVPNCYCDMECKHFKDCCREYLIDKENDFEQQNIKRQNCVLLTNEKFLVGERVGAFMIDRCNGTSEPCLLKDIALKSMVPVSTDEYTYSNDECALCNGVSNFRYWKAVFGNTDQNALFQMSRDNIDDRKVKEFLSNETSKHSQSIFFHPPTGFRPRFCPYDVLLAKTAVSSRYLHQNPVSCKKLYYKNIEECKEEGCCTSNDFFWCIKYDLRYYRKDESRRGGDFGVQVILNFGTFDTMEDPLQQTTREGESISFIDMMVHMIFEVHKEFNGSKINPTELDDCVQGLLLLYRSKPYHLLSIKNTYNTAYLGNGTHVTLHHLKSQASLDVKAMNKLLHQDMTFTCHTTGETKLLGNIKVEEATYVQDFFGSDLELHQTKQSMLIRLSRYILEDPEIEANCDNMSLRFVEKGSKTIVSITCVNDKEIIDKINGGQLPGSSFAILTGTFVLLFGR